MLFGFWLSPQEPKTRKPEARKVPRMKSALSFKCFGLLGFAGSVQASTGLRRNGAPIFATLFPM